MAKQTINIGGAPNDGNGDTGRVGADKINDNFTELYDYAEATTAHPNGLKLADDLVLPKATGNGIKVDTTTPTYPWHDIIGTVTTRGKVSDPTWSTYRGTISAYEFDSTSKYTWMVFHMPHDYVEGTDMYIHAHWSSNIAGVTGDVTWEFDMAYAKGYGQQAFTAPVTLTVTDTVEGTQYMHQIAEVQMSTSGGSATQLDTDDLEVDALILVRVRNSSNTLSSGNPFLHSVDVHYQSTNIGTKDKNAPFYT